MKILFASDWWFRIRAQILLNWVGRKFGWTRKPILINGLIAMLLSFAWWSAHERGFGAAIMNVLTILVNLLVGLVAIRNIDKKDGEHLNWESLRWYRHFWLAFLPLQIILISGEILLLVVDAKYWSYNHISHAICIPVFLSGQWLVWWMSTCVEAPPKEKKERKVAYAFR